MKECFRFFNSLLGSNPPANTTTPRFRTLPWHDDHPNKLELELRLAPDHLARTIDDAVARLDLTELYATYGGTGSDAHPPERLLRVVLYELRRGRTRPAQWHCDSDECEPVRWLLRGSVVSRSCWYAFGQRVAPLMLNLNQQVLAQAIEEELTPATRGGDRPKGIHSSSVTVDQLLKTLRTPRPLGGLVGHP